MADSQPEQLQSNPANLSRGKVFIYLSSASQPFSFDEHLNYGNNRQKRFEGWKVPDQWSPPHETLL